MSDQIDENEPKKKRAKKKPKTKPKKQGIIAKPKLIENRFIFRDQLTANRYDLVGEVIKNIESLTNPKDKLLYQMRLMEFAYHKLDAVAVLQPLDPSREGSSNQNSKPSDENTMDAEFEVKPNEDFNAMIRRI